MSESVFQSTALVTGKAAGEIAKFARVTGPVGTGRVFTEAGLTGRADGIAMRPATAANDQILVSLASGAGTLFGIAAGAITAGDTVYGAADGKLSDTQGIGAFAEGYAITDAAADGDIIEWRYKPELTAGTE